jgi:hypothetical protein
LNYNKSSGPSADQYMQQKTKTKVNSLQLQSQHPATCEIHPALTPEYIA